MSQQFVADMVAMQIIDELESIKIDHQKCGPGIPVMRPFDSGRKALLEQTIVGKPR